MDLPGPKKRSISTRLLIAGVVLVSLLLTIFVWWYYTQRIEALNQIIDK